MPKNIREKPIKGWKIFRLKDGTTRYLPSWANKPLKLVVAPDEALRETMRAKPPKDWRKVINPSRKSHR